VAGTVNAQISHLEQVGKLPLFPTKAARGR